MSKINDLAVAALNDLREIAADIDHLKGRIEAHHATFVAPYLDDPAPMQLEEATRRRLYINRGIVSLLEISTEQLVVQFR